MAADLVKFISHLNEELLASTDLQALLPETVRGVGELFDAAFVGCYLGVGDEFQEYTWARDDRSIRFSILPWARSVSHAGVRARRIDVGDGHHKMLEVGALGAGAIASVSLGRDEALHLVVALREDDRDFSDMEIAGLNTVTGVLALGASQANYKRQAMFDPKMGVYDGQYVDLALASELSRAKRFHTALTVMLLDVDGMSTINAKGGFDAGDRVLDEVGHVLHGSVRTCDYVVRAGGDEFLLILPATTVTGTRRIVERIIERVRRLTLGPIDWGLRISLSGGVAAADADTTTDSLVQTAQALLEQAKQDGGDRVLFPGGQVTEFLALPSFLSTADVVSRMNRELPLPLPIPDSPFS